MATPIPNGGNWCDVEHHDSGTLHGQEDAYEIAGPLSESHLTKDLDEEPPRDKVGGQCYVQLEHHPRLLQPMKEPSRLLDQHKVVMDAPFANEIPFIAIHQRHYPRGYARFQGLCHQLCKDVYPSDWSVVTQRHRVRMFRV
jgi:hypothetical protein